MPATHEGLALRLERLEHDLQELATAVSRRTPASEPRDLADRISFRAWMRISAPTFAVMVMGFTLLWNTQQTANAQLFEVSRSLGRLDGAITGLENRMASFDERLESLDERLESLGASVEGLGAAVERLAEHP